MIEYEQSDRAVAALDAVVAQTSGMIAGYEDGLVAGMMSSSMVGFRLRYIARSIGRFLVLTIMSSAVATACSWLRRRTILSGSRRQSDDHLARYSAWPERRLARLFLGINCQPAK
jgi:hypothetical protein